MRRSRGSTTGRAPRRSSRSPRPRRGSSRSRRRCSGPATTRSSRRRVTSRRSRSRGRPARRSPSGGGGMRTAGGTTWTSSSGCFGRTHGWSTSTRRTTRRGGRCRATVLDRVVELCAERGAALFCDEVYRELEHDPADAPPRGVRPVRAGRLARERLEDVRPARAAHRMDRVPRPRAARGGRRRRSSTRRSARARRASSWQRSHCGTGPGSSSGTARSSSQNLALADAFVERHAERRRLGAAGRVARSGSPDSRSVTRRRSASGSPSKRVCCFCPVRSTTSRATCGSGSGASARRRRSSA